MKRIYHPIAAIILAIMLLVPGVGLAVFASTDNSISIAEAGIAAMKLVENSADKLNGWENATLSEPVSYLFPDHTKSAYEFTVLNGDKAVGFIIVSAKEDWMPILEYSDGRSPSSYLSDAQNIAREAGFRVEGQQSDPGFFYWGALTYSVQVSDTMKENGVVIHLPTGVIDQLPTDQPLLQMNTPKAKAEWSTLIGSKKNNVIEIAFKSVVGSPVNAAVLDPHTSSANSVSYTSGFVGGVPAFYQSSYNWGHGDDRSYFADPYPYCVGYPDDPWRDWDGCAPIAAAMVLAFWHNNGYSGIPNPSNGETEDILIDHFHAYMNTSYEGATDSVYIESALQNVPYLYGYYGFDAIRTSTTWDWVRYEILSGRPFFLGVSGGSLGDHAVCVVGFDDNANTLLIHNTYDTSAHYLTWGDWSWSDIWAVHPG